MQLPWHRSNEDAIVAEKFSPPAPAIDESRKAHCADHRQFLGSCPVCKQACANFEPYPVRPSPASSARSFGVTGNITAATFGASATSTGYSMRDSEADAEVSLSLLVIRFILRLIWPFSRIL